MREAAYEIVYGTMEEGRHSDELFHRCLADREWTVPQKRNLKNLAFGTIERCIEIDALLNQAARIRVHQMEPSVRTVLRMALYEIRYMDQIPDPVSCNEAVELVRKKGADRSAAFVNGVLRTLVRQKDSLEVKKDWVRYSLPKELMDHLCRCYGRKTACRIAAAFLERRGETTLHIRTDRITVPEYREKLDHIGLSYHSGYYQEDALIVQRVSDVRTLPGYGEGLFFVQDESSMLPVACAGIQPGDVVADVCSAPGGKTIHALMKLQGKGRLLARDVSRAKVERIRENIRRMGFSNVTAEVRDAVRRDPENRGKADVVLADVLCSGIGIIGRKPEIKYHAMEHIPELVPLQREICRSSADLLKDGGVFIYSTCTISPAENEENVRWMEEELGFHRESLDPYLPEELQNRMTGQGMLQMLPGLQKSDGFFVARLRK